MDIKIGDFQILSYGNQFILNKKEKKGDKANNPGEEYYDFCGYYSDLVPCLKSIPKHAALRSDCLTMEALLNVLKEHDKLIRQYLTPQFETKPSVPTPAGPIFPPTKKLKRTK